MNVRVISVEPKEKYIKLMEKRRERPLLIKSIQRDASLCVVRGVGD